MQTYLKTKPVWIQLLLFVGMAFGLFMVLSLIGIAILSSMTGIGLKDLQNMADWDYTNPKMITYIRGLLVVQFIGLFAAPSLLYAYFADPKPLQFIGLKQPLKNRFWILGIVALLVAIPAVEYIGVLNQKIHLGNETQKWMKGMEEEAAKQIQFMLNKHTPTELALNLIFISLFAGIGEELFFRGILQRLFIRAFKEPWAGIVITAALFSAFHFQFFGFFPRLFLGVLLGAIYWYSGSLWTAILAHFLYDALIIVLVYMNPEMLKNADKPMLDMSNMGLMAVISLGLTVLVIWQMKKASTASYAELYKDDRPPKDQLTF
jgi:membrane protease YdiL (CAAX protease family)